MRTIGIAAVIEQGCAMMVCRYGPVWTVDAVISETPSF
jgi:hypothetical protein